MAEANLIVTLPINSIYRCFYRGVTRNFAGQESFVGLRALL